MAVPELRLTSKYMDIFTALKVGLAMVLKLVPRIIVVKPLSSILLISTLNVLTGNGLYELGGSTHGSAVTTAMRISIWEV